MLIRIRFDGHVMISDLLLIVYSSSCHTHNAPLRNAFRQLIVTGS
jgi:hypothetical protein